MVEPKIMVVLTVCFRRVILWGSQSAMALTTRMLPISGYLRLLEATPTRRRVELGTVPMQEVLTQTRSRLERTRYILRTRRTIIHRVPPAHLTPNP